MLFTCCVLLAFFPAVLLALRLGNRWHGCGGASRQVPAARRRLSPVTLRTPSMLHCEPATLLSPEALSSDAPNALDLLMAQEAAAEHAPDAPEPPQAAERTSSQLTEIQQVKAQQFADAVASGDVPSAMGLLDDLAADHRPSPALCSALSAHLMQLADTITREHIPKFMQSVAQLEFDYFSLSQQQLVLKAVALTAQLTKPTADEVMTCLKSIENMRINFSKMSNDSLRSVLALLDKVTLDGSGTVFAAYFLFKMGNIWKTTPGVTRANLLRNIALNVKEITDNSKHAAQLVASLGKMGCTLKALPPNPAHANSLYGIFAKALSQSAWKDGVDLMTKQNMEALRGMSKLGARASKMSPSAISWLETCLISTLPGMHAAEVVETLYSLGVMQFHWTQLSSELQAAVIRAITETLSRVKPFDVPRLLFALSKMEMQLTDAKSALADELLVIATKAMKPQGGIVEPNVISIIIRTLGKMGARWHGLPGAFRATAMQRVEEHVTEFERTDLFNVISGLGYMNLPMQMLPSSVVKELASRVPEHSDNPVQHTDVSLILRGLSGMGVVWWELLPPLQSMCVRMLSQMMSCEAESIGSILLSLGTLQVRWDQLPANIKEKLEVAVNRQPILENRQLLNIIQGLGTMEANWFKLSEVTRNALSKHLQAPSALASLSSQQVAYIFMGLAKMDAVWALLPHRELEGWLLQSLPKQDGKTLAALIRSLGKMEVAWTWLQVDTLRAIVAKIQSAEAKWWNLENTSRLLHALSWMSFDCDYATYAANPQAMSTDDREKMALLWKMHRLVVTRCKDLMAAGTDMTQDSVYFEWMESMPNGAAFLDDMGISKAAPSVIDEPVRMRGKLLADAFQSVDGGAYRVVENYPKASAVKMSLTVLKNDDIFAFVEVDHDENYWDHKGEPQLKRKEALKEHIIAMKYPQVPIVRVYDKHLVASGDLLNELVQWIISQHQVEPPQCAAPSEGIV